MTQIKHIWHKVSRFFWSLTHAQKKKGGTKPAPYPPKDIYPLF